MSDEPVLLHDGFAPITSAMGFLRAPVDVVSDGLMTWRRRIHGVARAEPLAGGFTDNVGRLEPLTGGVRPRELVVGTLNAEWSALFDCGVMGGDPVARVGYLAHELQVPGVVVRSIPERGADEGSRRLGSRQLELFSPEDTEFLNYVRTISVTQQDDRWHFDANGAVQDFEEVEAYEARRVKDRFTGAMLRRYVLALGLRPFDADFFPGPSVLVTNSAEPPDGAMVMSLHEVRQFLGLQA